jgi:hypothetical protein
MVCCTFDFLQGHSASAKVQSSRIDRLVGESSVRFSFACA